MAFNYSPGIVPRDKDDLVRFLEDELNRISAIIAILIQGHLTRNDVAPSKPREGDVRFADGTNWDPGNGKGIYWYDGSSWIAIHDKNTDTWDG